MLKKTSLSSLLLSIIFIGCGIYQPLPQRVPYYIKKIALIPFHNETPFFGLEDKLTLKLSEELIRDGRFMLVRYEDAEGYLAGKIKKYILSPLTYDANLVPTSYKLWIICDIYFVDKLNNITLWQEPNFEGVQIFQSATQPGGMTEEEARELIWETLSKNIIRRTVEGFGEGTGASEKKIPR